MATPWLAWENDPYWTYWITKTFLIATVFGFGTAWFGIGAKQGAAITAVHNVVLTVYYSARASWKGKARSPRAETHLEDTISTAQAGGDERARTCARGLLGVMALQRGEFDRAQRLLQESSRDLEATEPALAGWFRFNLPWITMAKGDVSQATKELEAVRQFGELTGKENLTVHAVTALAPLFALAGEDGRAAELAEQGVDVARRLGLRRVLVMALTRVAEVATLLGRGVWERRSAPCPVRPPRPTQPRPGEAVTRRGGFRPRAERLR